MIGPLLKVAAASMTARTLRNAAADVLTRALLVLGAGAGALVALICFSQAALTLLERHMDPAEAWAVVGTFYGVVGGILYFAATKRRG
jgi:predicted nicotinamide N-methyase